MTTYQGNAEGDVTATDDNGEIRSLGKYEWGRPSPSCTHLATELLQELLGDRMKVERIYRRFMHRTVLLWQTGRPWGMTSAELMAVVETIEKVAAETAPIARQAARERPQIVTDAAPPGGGWTQSPEIKRNDP